MLVKAGKVRREKGPHSNALKPLIEQPIAICLLMVAGGERGPSASRGTLWLIPPHSQDFTATSLLETKPHPEPGSRTSGSDRRQGGLCLCGAGCPLLAPGLCLYWLCVQLAAVKPCFLSGISVLTESIWALGELPASGGRDGGGRVREVERSFRGYYTLYHLCT